jgi:hypothetical protein
MNFVVNEIADCFTLNLWCRSEEYSFENVTYFLWFPKNAHQGNEKLSLKENWVLHFSQFLVCLATLVGWYGNPISIFSNNNEVRYTEMEII